MRTVTTIAALAMLAGAAHAALVGVPNGFRESQVSDVDGNKLWDSVEKAKQVMLRDVGLAREPYLSASDTLQYLVQESLLNVGQPDIFGRVYRAEVREVACMSERFSPAEIGQVLSVLQSSFAYNEIVSPGYQIVTDGMLEQARVRPDSSDAGCPDRRWRRNFYSKLPPRGKPLEASGGPSLDQETVSPETGEPVSPEPD